MLKHGFVILLASWNCLSVTAPTFQLAARLNPFDFGFEKDGSCGTNAVLHDLQEGEDVRGTGSLIDRDNIGMKINHRRTANAQAFATGLIQ